jgi:hypothetical protein
LAILVCFLVGILFVAGTRLLALKFQDVGARDVEERDVEAKDVGARDAEAPTREVVPSGSTEVMKAVKRGRKQIRRAGGL